MIFLLEIVNISSQLSRTHLHLLFLTILLSQITYNKTFSSIAMYICKISYSYV